MHLKGYYAVLFLLANMSLFTTCSLEDPEPSTFNFPINLEAEKEYSLITLNWTPVNVTDFKEYIILQSSDQIPASPTPTVSSEVSVVKRIDDKDITTFSSADILFTPRVCYKVYASIGDRFLQSDNICVDQDFTVIDGFYDKAAHEPGIDQIAIFDRLNSHLSAYNYKEGTIVKTVNEFSLSFPLMELSTWSGTTDLYAYDQSLARITKYTFPQLVVTHNKNFNGVLFAVKAHEQFLYVASDELSKTLRVVNRSNLAEVDSEEGLMGSRNLAVFPGDPAILLDINSGGILRYSISSNGHLTYIETKSQGILLPSIQSFTANGTELFIGGRQGEIIDREGNKVGSLVNGLNSIITVARFSEDETKVVYLISDLTTRIEVADITDLQNIRVLASFTVPVATYSDLIVDTDLITIMGVSFDFGQVQTFALKYPMP